jgi:hypothetical protein
MKMIHGAEKLISVFGKWPSFHDAEVHSLTYERSPEDFSIVAVIHVFQMTDNLDARGRFQLVNHTRVTFRFVDCENVRLEGFNAQNVLSSLAFTAKADAQPKRPFFVSFNASYGLDGMLDCRQIEVADASPWIPPHGVHESE